MPGQVYPRGGGETGRADAGTVYLRGGGGNSVVAGNGAGGLGAEDQARREAGALVLVVSRKGRRSGFRPAVQEGGRLRQTFRLDEPIRWGMEQACSQLNVGYSEFVEPTLVHYFEHLGLRYEGVPRPVGTAAGAAKVGGD